MAHTTKDNRDLYYRKAKEDGYRARSAYKLLEIFKVNGIFYPLIDPKTASNILLNCKCTDCSSIYYDYSTNNDVHSYYKCPSLNRIRNSVDLCAAPGSWSQCIRNLIFNEYNSFKEAVSIVGENNLCEKLKNYCNIRPVIVSIDLQEIAPIDGVYCLKGDITDELVIKDVHNLFLSNIKQHMKQATKKTMVDEYMGFAQLITCDGAPDVSGLQVTDAFVQAGLIRAAIYVCCSLLDNNGIFICKTFFNTEESPLFRQVSVFFDDCRIYKPAASRVASSENFIVAKGFMPLGRIQKVLSNDTNQDEYEIYEKTWVEPLLSSGDLSGYDKIFEMMS